jgi:hypothetical protein
VLLTEVRNRNLLGDDFNMQNDPTKLPAEKQTGATDPLAPKPDFPAGQLRPKKQI